MFCYSKLKWYEFKERPACSLSQGCEVMSKLLNLPCTHLLCCRKVSSTSEALNSLACPVLPAREDGKGMTCLVIAREPAVLLGWAAGGTRPQVCPFLKQPPQTIAHQIRGWVVRPLLKYLEFEQEDILGRKERSGAESVVAACMPYTIAVFT